VNGKWREYQRKMRWGGGTELACKILLLAAAVVELLPRYFWWLLFYRKAAVLTVLLQVTLEGFSKIRVSGATTFPEKTSGEC